MTFEKGDEFKSEIDVTVENERVHIGSEPHRNAIKTVYTYEDGIPIEDVEEVITLITEKIMELEDTAHFEYYNEMQDARALLMSREIPRRVDGFEHIVSEYEETVRSNDCYTMHGLRCSIMEKVAAKDDPTEAEVREKAESYIDSIGSFADSIQE